MARGCGRSEHDEAHLGGRHLLGHPPVEQVVAQLAVPDPKLELCSQGGDGWRDAVAGGSARRVRGARRGVGWGTAAAAAGGLRCGRSWTTHTLGLQHGSVSTQQPGTRALEDREVP